MEQPVRILDGDLETLGLQATLKMLSLGGKTGILRVSSGSETLQIALKDGHIVDLEESGVTPPDMIEVFRLLMHLTRPEASMLKQRADHKPANSLRVMVENQVIAADTAQQLGLQSVVEMDGGFSAWKSHGYPVAERPGKKSA